MNKHQTTNIFLSSYDIPGIEDKTKREKPGPPSEETVGLLGKENVHRTEPLSCDLGHRARGLTGHMGVPGTDDKLGIRLLGNQIKDETSEADTAVFMFTDTELLPSACGDIFLMISGRCVFLPHHPRNRDGEHGLRVDTKK